MAVTRHSDAVAPVRSSGPMTTWFARHASTSIGSLGRLFRQPFASLMIILVIAVTLAIPAALNLVVKKRAIHQRRLGQCTGFFDLPQTRHERERGRGTGAADSTKGRCRVR